MDGRFVDEAILEGRVIADGQALPTRIFLQVTIHLGNVLFVGFFLLKLDLWLLFGFFLDGRWHFFGGIDLVVEKFFELAGEENGF